jgi:hypothetical protein
VLNATTGALTAPTAVTSAASLTNNAVVLGAGSQGTQTLTAFTTDGVTQLNIGPADTTNNGILGLKGKTSGTATFTAPAVAGTNTNPIVLSNAIAVPGGAATTPSIANTASLTTGIFFGGGNSIGLSSAGTTYLGSLATQAGCKNTIPFGFAAGDPTSVALRTTISEASSGVLAIGTSQTVGDTTGNLQLNIVTKYGGTATVGQGVPSEIVLSDLTAQSAAITATNIIASAPRTGMYKVIWSATITTADGVSSVLGGTNGFQVVYTSPTDSVTKTTVPGNSVTSSANTTGTAVGGVEVVYAKTATAIQYKYDYTSATPGQMIYELHIRLVAL